MTYRFGSIQTQHKIDNLRARALAAREAGDAALEADLSEAAGMLDQAYSYYLSVEAAMV